MPRPDCRDATQRSHRAIGADRRARPRNHVQIDKQSLFGAGSAENCRVVAAREAFIDDSLDVMTDLREDSTGAHREVFVELDPHPWVGSSGMISSRASAAA